MRIRSEVRKLRVAGVVLVLVLLAACGDDGDGVGEESPEEDEVEETDAGEEEEEAEAEEAEHLIENGEVITILVGTDPGGGFDLNARTVAPYVESELRDLTGLDVTVIVENQPGAGMQVANERLAAASGHDTLAIVAMEVATAQQVVGGAALDIREFTWLGHYAQNSKAILIRKDLELEERNFEGLAAASQEQPLLWGNSGNIEDFRIMKQLLAEAGVDLVTDDVTFDGVPDSASALLRGDIDAMWTNESTVLRFVEENPELEALVSTACERTGAAPDLPNIVEEGVPGAEDVCNNADPLRRAFAGPPGMDSATADLLEEAFRAAINNAEQVAQAEEAGFEIEYMDRAELEEVAASLVDTYTRYVSD